MLVKNHTGRKYEKSRECILRERLEVADVGVIEALELKIFRLSLVVMELLNTLDLSDEAFLGLIQSDYTLAEQKK